MTRSMALAILAFSLLILANLATFGVLSFRSLSERMVTEKLWHGLRVAQSFLMEDATQIKESGAMNYSKRLAPRLSRLKMFYAVVVLDANGRVLHREMIGQQVVTFKQGVLEPKHTNANNSLRQIPVESLLDTSDRRLALEYNQDRVRKEVELLRREFNQKVAVAIAISLLLLCIGLGFVLFAYRRSKVVQEQARKADRMAYVGTLSSGLAHEIRNPLNAMNMNVQLIQEELEEMGTDAHCDILEMLNGTRNEVARLERLVSSFLTYARPTQLSKDLIQVNDLVEDLVQFLFPETAGKGIKLVLNLASDLPKIALDESQMRQAFLNVIQNAIQVSQSGERITLVSRKAGGDKILVVIQDEGPGISGEELKNISKEFYSTKRGGTGLGLPIALRIAELHMGGIKVESEIGKGTTITFILPMDQNLK